MWCWEGCVNGPIDDGGAVIFDYFVRFWEFWVMVAGLLY